MTLERVRADLADLDGRLLELVARRQELARSVGRAKDEDGRPIRDFDQEREVLERARRGAGRLGMSTEVAEGLMKLLVEDALTVQERQRVVARAGGSGRRVLVIGGAGRMGGWFVRFLTAQGFQVAVADPAASSVEGTASVTDWQSASLDQDFIVVAADLRATARILEELAERRPHGSVFDIGSLKGPLRGGFEKLASAGVSVTSLHPMFGPDTTLLSGRHVILVDVGVPEATAVVRELFASTMVEVVEMDLESHDRLVGYVLGLSHALNIAFFTALAESGESAPRLAEISSTTFDRQLDIAARVARENPHLYFEIQHLNAYGDRPLAALLDALERVLSLVRAGDEAGFVELMDRGRSYFSARAK